MKDTKMNLALIYGGRSVEHDISVLSAKNVYDNIDHDRFEVVLLGIDAQGGWHHCSSPDAAIAQGDPVALILGAGKGVFHNLHTKENLPLFDVAFPVLHGTDGEDGSVQGMLQVAGIPYLGSGVLGSSVAMSKVMSKKLLQQAGIPVSPFKCFTFAEKERITLKYLEAELGGLPMILKPANLGSSVGVSKVTDEASLQKALVQAFAFDDEVIIEQFIEGREMEIAVMGNDKPQASVPGEVIVAGKHEFYSFEAKYVDADGAKIVMPAEVSQ